MDVAELVAVLGLAIDEADWERGNELIEKTRKGVEAVSKASAEGLHKEKEEGSELNEILEKGLETFVGYEGIKSIGEMVEHTIEATISAKHLGERLGITTQAVQELGYAADVTGLSQSVLQSGLQRLSYNLQQTGKQAEHFVGSLTKLKLGLTASELKKLPLDEQLGKLADGFKRLGAGSETNALAMKIFGRTAGPQMVPLLLEGSAGIKELREEADRLGVTMSEEGVEKAEQFEKAQKRLQARIGAVKDKIVMALLPALEQMVTAFSTVFDYVTSHEDILIGVIAAIGAAIVYAGHAAVLAWAPILIPFAAFIAAVGIVVVVVMKLQTLLGRTAKIILGISLIIMMWVAPLTATVALITLIASNWDAVVDSVASFWESLKETSKAVGEWFADLPVIKQLIELYNLVTNSKGHGEGGTASKSDVHAGGVSGVLISTADYMQGGAISRTPDAVQKPGAAGAVTLTSHITINTGAKSEEVIEQIRKQSEKDWKQIHHAVKKGG